MSIDQWRVSTTFFESSVTRREAEGRRNKRKHAHSTTRTQRNAPMHERYPEVRRDEGPTGAELDIIAIANVRNMRRH